MDQRLSGGLNSVPYLYRCDTKVLPMYYRSERCDTVLLPYFYRILQYGFVNVGRAPVEPRNGSTALWWPIAIFQVLSRRSSADFLAAVNFVLRFRFRRGTSVVCDRAFKYSYFTLYLTSQGVKGIVQ